MSLKSVLIGLDQLANTLIGGKPDETLSARAWRLRNNGWGATRKVIDALFFFDPNHCQMSYESEQQRLQLPTEYRNGSESV